MNNLNNSYDFAVQYVIVNSKTSEIEKCTTWWHKGNSNIGNIPSVGEIVSFDGKEKCYEIKKVIKILSTKEPFHNRTVFFCIIERCNDETESIFKNINKEDTYRSSNWMV